MNKKRGQNFGRSHIMKEIRSIKLDVKKVAERNEREKVAHSLTAEQRAEIILRERKKKRAQ